MKKPRSDNKLLNLPEEQQAQLAEWLLSGMPYHQAKQLLFKEFSVSVSLSAFSSFWSNVCAPELMRRRTRAVKVANEVAEEASRNPGKFDAATIDALKQKAFEQAISPGSNPKDVKALFSLVLKARDQDIDKEQLEFDKEKFQFDAAKACLEHLPKLRQIASQNIAEPDKINQFRQLLFGKLPTT